jgi:uncharacterized surface protein with fasciclin (FAS1) repeats
MKKLLIIPLLILAVFFSCDPYEGTITPAFKGLPISSLLEKDSAKYSQWVGILKNSDLFNTLNLSANYTCFVPNDSAVTEYLKRNSYASINDIPVAEAKYLVKYHTIKGKIYQQSLFENGVIPDTTATGDFLTIEMRGGGLNAIYVNGEAHIAKLDIIATNGVIHVVDDVLTPVTETIWQKMEKPEYSIMKEAIQATGYNQLLNTIFANELNPTTGQYAQRKKSYTFFAVPNDVFAAKGITNFEGLKSTLGVTETNYADKTNGLNRYVAYHILGLSSDLALLSTFPANETSKNIQTLAENQLINVTLLGDNVKLNSSVSLRKYNINTKNGVLHEVDDVMPVVVPAQTTVRWELTDYSDVASLFASTYRKIGTSTVTSAIKKGEVTSYNWEATPSDKNNNAVKYLVRGQSDNTYVDLINNDCLVLELGLYGWVEMITPTIIAGKYNMKVVYLSRASSTQNGKFIAIFDGNNMGSEIATHGASAIKAEMRTSSLGQVTFTETTTHKLRLLAADNVALYIDYIIFEKVN